MRDKHTATPMDKSTIGIAPGELGGKLRGLSLRRQVIVLAFWPLLEFAMGSAVSFVDMVIAGGLGESGIDNTPILDAMSFGSYIGWLLFILQGAVATGTNALVSRAVGGNDMPLARRAMGQSITLGFLAGLISCILLIFVGRSLIGFVGLNPIASDYGYQYISILSLSAPLTGILVSINATLRGSGDTRTPFEVTLVVNIVNVVLSVLLTAPWSPIGGYGVAGIAAGTVGGWAVGVALALWKTSSPRQLAKREQARGVAVHFQWRDLRIERETSRRILRVGLPSGIEILGMWVINFMGLRFIEQLGTFGALGAHGVAIRLESISFLPGFAIGVAAQTLAGQYLGANNPEKAAAAVKEAWKIGVLLMGSIGIIFLAVPELLVSVISRDNLLIQELASPLIRLCGLIQPFFATCIVMKMAMRGAGASRMVMQTSYMSMITFRLLGLYLVVHVFNGTLFHVWVIISMDLVSQALLFSRQFFIGTWLKFKV